MTVVREGCEFVNMFLLGCHNVNLYSQKSINRKEQSNMIFMNLMAKSCLSIKNAVWIPYDFPDVVLDLSSSIRSVLCPCTIVQPQFISSGVYYYFGLQDNLLRYVELRLCDCDLYTLDLYINADGISTSTLMACIRMHRCSKFQ